MAAALRFDNIGKVFPGVRALDGISFDVHAGQVHGLMGENGAGKSTLLKILGGEYQPDSGGVLVDGRAMRFPSAAASIAAGVAVIHQELQYVPDLTVAENLLLGRLPNVLGWVRKRDAQRFVRERLAAMGVDLDPQAKLCRLSIAQRQMVEICKALMRNARVIALDEPTSSLSHRETEVLFALVDDLRRDGRALIYISHRMDEIYRLCDACTIFRDGRQVASHASLADVPRESLVRQMVGREISDIYHYEPRALGGVRLSARALEGDALRAGASFDVRAGEIVGFFGLVGAGRSELMRVIYGADRRTGGALTLDGEPLDIRSTGDAIRHGIVLCPEDRKEEGIVAHASVAENINISCRRHTLRAGLFLDRKREAQTAERFIKLLKIKTPNRRQKIRFLSGGNQQKAILARWLAEPDLKVVILDEPTRGIDVGAKHEIYGVIYELAKRGCAIVMVSSELPEVLGVSDRIVVMREGRIAGELARDEANEEAVLNLALPQGATARAA
ncbi:MULTISPECIES: L-arabinose ABC transporter ATP-binding protein AraG [Burkholderia]|uniref:L-arabinose transporter ATP-binding protein n=1 Tax=Burkholderia savannae TaxID=1637837 RepID=A0ABR5TIF4_9BURK|nr:MULTISPECIES: L-arabinose ABC transporter ATP-binding protein AraG [Burkholderia]AOJ82476.1 L-arabinose transporter ATP-binding protein [Burkholderia savannae]AOK48634.1 L-arabinose transporter ATP-binding protein [Burkholderia sp. MSMB617WGS]KGR93747.1 ABC transporter family protein [Burkholderia sp. ABCPW 111]KVK79708.1 L-arabinose transporter ATP-binding protein [Burkholderia sp. MSMB1498]KWZ44685.1 L-arabinose transporter ATP-binding protein [Burkholderia savannae]